MFVNTCRDIDYHILSFCYAQDLCRAAQVNKKWKKRANSNNLWGKFYPHTGIPAGIKFKQHYNVKGIISLGGLIQRIENFSKQVNNEQNGEFCCFFPTKTRCFITVKIKNHQNTLTPLIKECYWFLQTGPLDNPIKDVITLTKDCSYIVHIRVPRNLYFKNTANKIIDLLAETSDRVLPNIYSIRGVHR